MTVRTPPGVLNTESTDSSVQRDVHRSLLGGQLTSFAGGVGAVNGAAHGVCGAGHLAVSQSATPAMSVDVAAGSAFITGTASALQGPYNMVNDASVTLAIAAADATNPRRDLVIAQIRDDTYDGSGFRDARLTVVTGTPAASPSDPSLSAHPNALVLARVSVAALASTITNANITDLRPLAGFEKLYQESADILAALGVAGSGWTSKSTTSGIVAGGGWSVDSYASWRNGPFLQFLMAVTRTGSPIANTTSGNIANQLVATLPSSERGSLNAALSIAGSGAGGRVTSGFFNPSGGDVSIGAIGGTSNFATSEQVTLGGFFFVGT